MKRIRRHALIIGALLLAAGLWKGGLLAGLSVVIGVAAAFLNLVWLEVGIDAALGRGGAVGGGSAAVRYILRLVLIFTIVFAIFHFSFLSLGWTLAGLSVVIFGGMAEAAVLLIRHFRRES